MFELNIISKLDEQAANLDKLEADKNVYEFDLSLWSLLRSVSEKNPRDVMTQFSLDIDVVNALSNATDKQLSRLSSGVFMSFKLETSETLILQHLDKEYDPAAFVNQYIDEFDAAYWILFNRVANKDATIAKEVFAVSLQLSKAIAKASHSQLRFMSSVVITHFSLRFSKRTILEILNNNADYDRSITQVVLKKIQQSLTWNEGVA